MNISKAKCPDSNLDNPKILQILTQTGKRTDAENFSPEQSRAKMSESGLAGF
jgi:hypothetical protein